MKIFNLGNGHTLEVEKANRGIEDDYYETNNRRIKIQNKFIQSRN